MADPVPPMAPAFRALLALTDPWLEAKGGAPPLPPGLEWPQVLAHARRHRVIPFLAHRLEALGMFGELPPGIALVLRREGQLAHFHEMAMLGTLRRVKHAFDEQNVEFLVIKGLVLSSACYGRLGLRTNRDIDLLVSPALLGSAHAILVELGFRRIEPAEDLNAGDLAKWTRRKKDWVYASVSDGTILELHHRLFDNPFLLGRNRSPGARRVTLVGQVEVLTFDSGDELAYLALHGAMHAWSRLKWLLDIAFIFRLAGPDGLVAAIGQRRGQPATRALRQAAGMCHDLFGVEVLPNLKRSWTDSLLISAARKAMIEGGPAELEDLRFGTTLKNASHYLLGQNPAYLASELMYDLGDTSRDEANDSTILPNWFSRPIGWVSRHWAGTRLQ